MERVAINIQKLMLRSRPNCVLLYSTRPFCFLTNANYKQFQLSTKSDDPLFNKVKSVKCQQSRWFANRNDTKHLSTFSRQKLLRLQWAVTYATESGDSKKKADGTVNIPFWGRLLIVSSIAGILYYMFYSADRSQELEDEKFRYEEFKKIEMGGDWTLTDHYGNKRSSTDFRGEWIIIYMGFTHCPDICPEEMEKLGKIVKTFDENPDLPDLQPMFITLDPERDSPSVIKDYLKDFASPRIIGFTGTEDEIREIAKKFRAYFGKGPKDSDNDYIVDHTIITYLINPKGEFVNYFDRSVKAENIIKTVTEHIKKYNELEKRNLL